MVMQLKMFDSCNLRICDRQPSQTALDRFLALALGQELSNSQGVKELVDTL